MSRELAGRRVVVTRSAEQAEALCAPLRALGAEPIVFPVIRIEPLAAPELTEEVAALSDLDWLVLTSVNAVEQLLGRLESEHPEAVHSLPRIAVVGEATARALTERGLTPQVVPGEFRGEALVESMVESMGGLEGRRVLLPRSRIGRPEIGRALRERGALVRELALYDTVRAQPDREALEELARGVDAVTFTSPSGVRGFLAILDEAGLGREPIASAVIACIGPVTAEEARARGLHVEVVPERYTVPDLVAALAARFRRLSGGAGARRRAAGGRRS